MSPVDVIEAVAQDRDADRGGDRAEHEEEQGGEDVRLLHAVGCERPREADEERDRHQHCGKGQPLELEPLDPLRAPEAHAHSLDARKQAGDHAEEGERPEHSQCLRQGGQRPIEVLVGGLEGLGVEEAQDEKKAQRHGRGDRYRPPPRRWQTAIGKDERDRDQHPEQQRPGRLVPQHRPLRGGQRARALPHGVVGVGPGSTEAGKEKAVRQQQPADRMPGAAHSHQQADPTRGKNHGNADHGLPPRVCVRTRKGAQHARERAKHHSTGREHSGPKPRPAHALMLPARRRYGNSASTYIGHANIKITLDRYGHLMAGNEAEAAKLPALHGKQERPATGGPLPLVAQAEGERRLCCDGSLERVRPSTRLQRRPDSLGVRAAKGDPCPTPFPPRPRNR